MKHRSRIFARIFLLLLCGIRVFLSASSIPQDQNIVLIREAIKAKGANWTPKETWVSRLSNEEFKMMLGDRTREREIVEPMLIKIQESYPASIDWRSKDGHNFITSVKNQMECGSCVAFAAVAALEALICIEMNRPDEDIDLSEMAVFMCGGWGCLSGWDNQNACSYLANSGAPDELCWPYVPHDSPCSNSCYNQTLRTAKINDYGFIFGEEAYKTCVTIAPIMATMNVYEDFESYDSGIYEHVWGDYVGAHSICIIGYDTSGYEPYWIVKNSWGADDWGEAGFAKIKMGECAIETGGYWISDASLPSYPAAPTNLSANPASGGAINLAWHDNSNNEMKFEVQRQLGSAEFEHLEDVSGNSTSYLDGSAEGETNYSYRVRALNIAGSSGFTNIVNITTPPKAPTELVVELIDESTVRLEWQDNSLAEDGFEVWDKAGNGNWTLKNSVGPNICSTEIVDLSEYTLYYFRVRAYNTNGSSAWSNEISLSTPLKAPSNLVTTASGSDSIYLYWQDNSNKESGFEILQQESGGEWFIKATVGANVTLKEILGLTPGTTYCYKIRAYKLADQSGWSNTSCATTHSGVPVAPSNLRATGFCWEVKLTWNDNSNNETGFKIYRQSGSEYFEIDTVGPNTTTYWDVDLICGQLWCYNVRAFNLNGNSPACPSRCAKTSYCYQCMGGLSLHVSPDKLLIDEGETVTYSYRIENKGDVDLSNIEISDSEFGQILLNGALKKGEIMIINKAVALTRSLTNTIEATGMYSTLTKESKYVAAHASVSVEIR
jgi:hypothetical protein